MTLPVQSGPSVPLLREAPELFTLSESERDLILGAMRGWLVGEPVWPYAEVIARWGEDFEMFRRRWARERTSIENHYDLEAKWIRQAALHGFRREWIREFGFAIPDLELIEALAKVQPVVEIGAGSGYLTALARAHGIDIVGTDVGPSRYGFEAARYDPGQRCLAGKTAVRRFRDRTVFCAWPSLGKTWFRQALRAMRIGQHLIVIREDACAEHSAWEYLDTCFVAEANIDIPAWPYMNDFAAIYRKRRHKPRT